MVYVLLINNTLVGVFSSIEKAEEYLVRNNLSSAKVSILPKQVDELWENTQELPKIAISCYRFQLQVDIGTSVLVPAIDRISWQDTIAYPKLSFCEAEDQIILSIPTSYGLTQARQIADRAMRQVREMLNTLTIKEIIRRLNEQSGSLGL